MDKIVVFFQPFDILQNIVIYQNGEVVEIKEVEIDRIPNVVKGLCSTYGITDVDLKGSQAYLEKYKAEILTNYSLLNVNII
jgi:hypothetical protein